MRWKFPRAARPTCPAPTGLDSGLAGERRGRKVKIAVPQRAQKADLIELVERNATYELQRAQRGPSSNC